MGHATGLIRYLSMDEMDRLHSGALDILETAGMRVEHPEAMDYLRSAGCIIDDIAGIVKFPRAVVENAAGKMRRDYKLTDRAGITSPMRYTEMYMSTVPQRLHTNFTSNAGGFPVLILDLQGNRRYATIQDVIDNEIIGYIKRALRGFEVTEETLALDVIKDVGIGGNFLTHEHTAMNYKKEFYFSELLERLPWSSWEKQEIKGMEEKARERVKKILSSSAPEPLDEHKAREIDSIAAKAVKS